MLLDNKTQGKVGDVLAEGIGKDAQLSIISSLFSIYGFAAMKKELARIGGLRLLLPLDDTNQEQPMHVPGLAGTEADRWFRNALNLTQIARECALWLDQKVEIKAITLPVPQNLFYVKNPNGDAVAIHGSSTFTSSGLGFAPSARYEMNTCFTTATETASLLSWFESIWTNTEATRDIKAAVLQQLEGIFASKSPQLIYFLTLYNIFREFLGELQATIRNYRIVGRSDEP